MELMDGRYVPPNGSFMPFLAKSCQAVTGHNRRLSRLTEAMLRQLLMPFDP